MLFNTAIKACANAGMDSLAESYYDEMRRTNIDPNMQFLEHKMFAECKNSDLIEELG